MGKEPDEIRQDIAHTREEMGATAQALGHKADVKSRAKESIADKRDRLMGQMRSTGSSVSDAVPDTDDVRGQAKQAVGIAQENPLGLAIGAVAVGFVAGLALPVSRMENERLGPVSEQIRDQAKDLGQDALEHGKAIAQDAADTIDESTREHARELKDSAEEKVSSSTSGDSTSTTPGATSSPGV